jgi:DNA-directed RNA polymerase subunit RPC12/RpoP
LTIEFSCQHCGKQLSTSDDKAGRKAKCPQCGDVIVVPAAAVAEEQHIASEVDAELAPPPLPGTGGMKSCPMCGERIPISATKCDFCGEELVAVPGARTGRPRKLEVGDVMSTAWDHYTKNFGTAFAANLVYFILIIVSAIPLIGLFIPILIALDRQNEPEPIYLLLMIPALLPLLCVTTFLMPGYNKIYLNISRGDPAEIGTLFSGGRYFFKTLIANLVFGLIFGLGLVLCIVPGVLLMLRYWPYLCVIVDEDPPGLECFNRSAELTKGNWGAMFVVGIISYVLNYVAQNFTCGIGSLFTQPLCSLFVTTAYVKMTGQERPR